MRFYFTFDADFPEDAEWNQDGDLIVPEGRAVIDAIKSGIISKGLAVAFVQQHSYYGWALQSDTFWCMVQSVEPWIMIVENRVSILRRIINKRDSNSKFHSFLNTLESILRADGRFDNIKTYSREEDLPS